MAARAFALATGGNLKKAQGVLDKEATSRPDRKDDLERAANYLRDNASGLVDYRKKLKEKDENMRPLGAIESNIDKILANRMKKKGMAWTSVGAHRMAKVIQMHANQQPYRGNRQHSSDSKKQRIRESIQKIKESVVRDPAGWLGVKMPALVGPHQDRPWAKVLREIANPVPAGMQS